MKKSALSTLTVGVTMLALTAVAVASGPLPDYYPVPSTEAQARHTLFRWMEAMKTRQPEEVAALYARDAVLVPDLWPSLQQNEEDRRAYFNQLLNREGLQGQIVEEQLTMLSKDIAVHSGTYTFHFMEGGQKHEVPARYTFIYRQTPKGWQIVHHHSSRAPEVPAEVLLPNRKPRMVQEQS